MASVKINFGKSPLVTVAIHNGHQVRPELLPYMNLTESERLREEDPFTSEWIQISDNRIKVNTSRFETDVNRPIEKCIYQKPEDAWGLQVWNEKLPQEVVERSLQVYKNFYTQIEGYFNVLFEQHPWLIVYDLHSYNYRRSGVDKYDPPEQNPEINVGTMRVEKKIWKPVIERLLDVLQKFNYEGRHLDVRENIKFGGGEFAKWLSNKYGERICPVAVEIKKIFMDEWTGQPDHNQIRHLRELLIASIKPVVNEASKIKELNENRRILY